MRRWTKSEISRLKELYDVGMTTRVIAAELKRGQHSVLCKLGDLRALKEVGVRNVIWTEEDDKTLMEYYDKGMKQYVIAEKMGRTYTAVRSRIYNLRRVSV